MHLPNHNQFAAVLHQPRPRSASTPSLLAAWRDFWRDLPADMRRETIDLLLCTPAILECFALAWAMLP